LYLLISVFFFSIRKTVPLYFSITLLIIMILPGLVYYYAADVNPQWKEAALYIDENAESEDVIVIAPHGDYGIQSGIQQSIFTWYFQGSQSSCSLAGKLNEPIAISNALRTCISGKNRFWVIVPDDRSESANRYKKFFHNPNQPDLYLINEHQFIQLQVYLLESEIE
jgi:hypothetical protein